ncbi:hypothetical protein ACRB68_69890 [Actinomadura sp. RB68]|uniref:Resolvase/invertase-type recombinase catalytic domain-containing protein n=1 Tax=Actinomadura macrotermitis TaxID=2585200 RepID=A0A7K0C635_9ACTN|nr:hypothetical protein [Actinomadura macrotermitis]
MLIRRGLHLRVESGLLSGIDLAADDPGTKMMVNVLASVLEFQRDMISENTRQGVAAAEGARPTGCTPPASQPLNSRGRPAINHAAPPGSPPLAVLIRYLGLVWGS